MPAAVYDRNCAGLGDSAALGESSCQGRNPSPQAEGGFAWDPRDSNPKIIRLEAVEGESTELATARFSLAAPFTHTPLPGVTDSSRVRKIQRTRTADFSVVPSSLAQYLVRK